MSPPNDMPPAAPTPPGFSVEAKFHEMDSVALANLRRDVSRIFTVTDRTEDRLAVLIGRVSAVELVSAENTKLLVSNAKLLVAIAEKLGVTP